MLFLRQLVTCCLCGRRSTHPALKSIGGDGNSDLDLRPAGDLRGTMAAWLQECPGCRYVHHDLSERLPKAAAIVALEAYQRWAPRWSPTLLATRFARHALLLQRSDPEAAGQAWLQAAWLYDDILRRGTAVECRLRAAELWRHRSAEEARPASRDLVLADVLRRAGRFREAEEVLDRVERRPDCAADSVLAACGAFERQLVAAGDRVRHTVREALRFQRTGSLGWRHRLAKWGAVVPRAARFLRREVGGAGDGGQHFSRAPSRPVPYDQNPLIRPPRQDDA